MVCGRNPTRVSALPQDILALGSRLRGCTDSGASKTREEESFISDNLSEPRTSKGTSAEAPSAGVVERTDCTSTGTAEVLV